MAKYNVHAGHCPDGKGASGAVGLLKESTEARKVKKLVIKKLKQKGHTVYDCTCDVKTTQSGCLVKIVDKCNKHKVSYDISIHLNSGRNDRKGDGKTGGVEAWIYDTANTTTKKKAESIVKAICKETGLSIALRNGLALTVTCSKLTWLSSRPTFTVRSEAVFTMNSSDNFVV